MKTGPKLFFSSFALKVMALFFMTLDHVGVMLMSQYNGVYISDTAYQVGQWFRYFGRIAMPLFCFLAAEAIRHTSDFKKYAGRIGLFAVIIALGTVFAEYVLNIGVRQANNAFIDIFVAATFVYFLTYLKKPGKQKLFALLALLPLIYAGISTGVAIYEKYTNNVLSVVWFPAAIRAPYGIFALALVGVFYLAYPLADKLSKATIDYNGINLEVYRRTPEYRRSANLVASALMIAVFITFYLLSFIGMDSSGNKPYDYLSMSIENYGLLAIIILVFYNGEKGYSSKWWKWFSYFYFPLHMILIYLIFYVTFI